MSQEIEYAHHEHEEVFGSKFIGAIVEVIHEWFLRFGTLFLSAAIIAVGIDLVSGDGLSTMMPQAAVYIGTILVIGIEAQTFVLWRRAYLALKRSAWWSMAGWGAFALAMTIYIGEMFTVWTLEHQVHLTEGQALSILHLSFVNWAIQRGVLGAVMAMTAALAIVSRPPRPVVSTAEKVAAIEEEAALTMARAKVAQANAFYERTQTQAELDNAELHRANAAAKAAHLGTAGAATALAARQAAAALFKGENASAGMGLPAPARERLTDRAFVPASLDISNVSDDSDDDPEPPTSPTDGPRRRGRPRGSKNRVQFVSNGADDAPFSLSTRRNAGRNKFETDPTKIRQVARARELLLKAEEMSTPMQRVTVSVRNLSEDKFLKDLEIAPSTSQAREIIHRAQYEIDKERAIAAARGAA